MKLYANGILVTWMPYGPSQINYPIFIFCLFVFLFGMGGTKSQHVIEQAEKKLKHENKYASEYTSEYPHCCTSSKFRTS